MLHAHRYVWRIEHTHYYVCIVNLQVAFTVSFFKHFFFLLIKNMYNNI